MREVIMGTLMGVLVVLVCVLLHLHNSLVIAVNELHMCEQQGGIACHIERDGLNYDVYGREKQQ